MARDPFAHDDSARGPIIARRSLARLLVATLLTSCSVVPGKGQKSRWGATYVFQPYSYAAKDDSPAKVGVIEAIYFDAPTDDPTGGMKVEVEMAAIPTDNCAIDVSGEVTVTNSPHRPTAYPATVIGQGVEVLVTGQDDNVVSYVPSHDDTRMRVAPGPGSTTSDESTVSVPINDAKQVVLSQRLGGEEEIVPQPLALVIDDGTIDQLCL